MAMVDQAPDEIEDFFIRVIFDQCTSNHYSHTEVNHLDSSTNNAADADEKLK